MIKKNDNDGLDMHFAVKVLKIVAITTVVFTVAQYVSFLITKEEQATLIQWFYTVVGIEVGALMLKRVAEVIVARVKKKEKLKINNNEGDSGNGDY